MDVGFLQVTRIIEFRPWYSDTLTVGAFIRMMMRANWKDGRFEGREIKRGQFVCSRAKLAEILGVTERQVRTITARLKSTGDLTSESTTQYTIYTIVNYDKCSNDNIDNIEKRPTKRPANDQRNDQQTPTIEERKKERREESIIRKALSGSSPDPLSPLVLEKRDYRAEALEVLAFLNEKTGHSFEPVPSNLKLIMCRLKEPGTTVAKCRAVIAMKCREWASDPKMSQYRRPATLFNSTNFAQYKGQLKQLNQPIEVTNENPMS